jgi:hypothetical protein
MWFKNIVKSSLISSLFLFTFYSCKKQKHLTPLEQLPAFTDTGANTFGCLVDGKAVVIHKPFLNFSPGFGCQYNQTYNSTAGYLFALSASDIIDGCHFKTVGMQLDSIQQLDIGSYTLNTGRIIYGKVGYVNVANGCPPSPLLMYTTGTAVAGKLTITHFDQHNQIVSGTFYFDAVESTTDDTVHVTDGRFDMKFTQ